MTPDSGLTAAQMREMAAELQRLIDALDRRVPRLERAAEAEIARDAADLRQRARTLLDRLESRVERE